MAVNLVEKLKYFSNNGFFHNGGEVRPAELILQDTIITKTMRAIGVVPKGAEVVARYGSYATGEKVDIWYFPDDESSVQVSSNKFSDIDISFSYARIRGVLLSEISTDDLKAEIVAREGEKREFVVIEMPDDPDAESVKRYSDLLNDGYVKVDADVLGDGLLITLRKRQPKDEYADECGCAIDAEPMPWVGVESAIRYHERDAVKKAFQKIRVQSIGAPKLFMDGVDAAENLINSDIEYRDTTRKEVSNEA